MRISFLQREENKQCLLDDQLPHTPASCQPGDVCQPLAPSSLCPPWTPAACDQGFCLGVGKGQGLWQVGEMFGLH